MDPDKLAERDRARRLRQLRNAKLQGIALLSCVVVGVALALSLYFGGDPVPKVEKEAPTKPATEPELVVPVVESAPSKVAAPLPTTMPIPPEPTPEPATAKVQTIQRAPAGMKPVVPVANVLASIGVADSEKAKQTLPKVEEARRVLELLSKASHVSGRLDQVIIKPGIELRMKEFYEARGQRGPEVGEQVADFEIQMSGQRYLDVVYKNPTHPSGTVRASFMRDEKGMVRVDWESFTGFSAMDMRVFRDTKPETPVTMRVYASVDEYFNYEFTDPKRYLSVRLRNADGSEAVNGFCELGGRVATAITARLATATAASGDSPSKRVWAPIIVKLRFPPKAQSDHCVELMDLMHGQWLAPAGLAE